MKKIIITTTTIAIALFMMVGPVLAQDSEPSAGMTPASPFFFLERFFEGIGTFLTFGNSDKAERYLALAAERLAEAKVLAEEGNEEAVAAVALYEEQYAKAKEQVLGIKIDIELEEVNARVTDAATRHLAVLDEVLERVPEQAKESIKAAKERSMTGQIEALRGIAERDPEAAVDIFARAAEGRLMAAQARANRGGDDDEEEEVEDVEDAIAEYEKYAEFGTEISGLAQGIQTGTTTVEQLVERATSHHRDVLRDVQSKVPPQAQESIERALDKSTPKLMEGVAPVQTGRPAGSVQEQRSIPENSIERTNTDDETEEVEIENDDEDRAEGPPPGIPFPVPVGAY